MQIKMKKISFITLCSVLFLSLFSCVSDDEPKLSNELAGKTFVLDKSSMRQDEDKEAIDSELIFISNKEMKLEIRDKSLMDRPELKEILKEHPQIKEFPFKDEPISLTFGYTYDEPSGLITLKVIKSSFTSLKSKIKSFLKQIEHAETPYDIDLLMPMIELQMQEEFKRALEYLKSIKYDKDTKHITMKGIDERGRSYTIVFIKK